MRKADSASSILTLALLFFVLLPFKAIHCTTYFVGDRDGWGSTRSMELWPTRKDFFAGDLLIFVYDPKKFDVAVVTEAGFESCTVNEGAKVYNSGNVTISLVLGENYFIDSVHDVCAAGVRMEIITDAPPASI